jgi:hypothetical protein
VEWNAIAVTALPTEIEVVRDTDTYFVVPANAETTLPAPMDWLTVIVHDAPPTLFVVALHDCALAPDPMVKLIVLPEIGLLGSSRNTAEKAVVEPFGNEVTPVYVSVVVTFVITKLCVRLLAE